MAVTIPERVLAVAASVWSFLFTVARSLFTLFSSFGRRSFVRPTTHTSDAALTRARSRLRPILLTPRSIAHANRASASGGSPKSGPLDPDPDPDPELGLSISDAVPAPPTIREATPDMSAQTTAASSVLPLTPPDRAYLAPVPSPTDCPYAEPWPTTKPRPASSPLRTSIDLDPALPAALWTSTPCKKDDPTSEPANSLDASALASISHALISRSQSSLRPYDDASDTSASSDTSLIVNCPPDGPETRPALGRQPTQTRVSLANQPFHRPDPYGCTWRRQSARLPGKPGRTHAYARSCSHVDLRTKAWYKLEPASRLSPVAQSPGGSSASDEDELPLSRLRDRLVRHSGGVGLAVAMRRSGMSPTSRRMSDGCLLGMTTSTPTPVGVSASSRNSLAFAADGYSFGPKDWLEALSLRFSPEHRGHIGSTPEHGASP